MYTVKFEKIVEKDFKKLGINTGKYLMNWIRKNLHGTENLRDKGTALVGDKKGYWRYRIADYRLIAKIDSGELKILAIRLGHKIDIYK